MAPRIPFLIKTIFVQMAQIETDRGLAFRELDRRLEMRIYSAVISEKPAHLEMIIARLDRMMEVSK